MPSPWPARVALSLLTVALVAAASPARATQQTHVVEPGDTLWELAEAHGCTVAQLRAANDMDREDPLVLGRRLVIPDCAGPKRAPAPASARVHTVAPGDTLAEIAATHATTTTALRELNHLRGSVIRTGQTLRLPVGPWPSKTGQSRGPVDAGSLADPDQLGPDPAYHLRRPERTWATAHLVGHVARAVTAVHATGLPRHPLAIGDLSAHDGGPLEGHRTHQSGRDVDLGFYFRSQPKGYPAQFVAASDAKLDADATWALVEELVATADQPGGVVLIYLDYDVQAPLYDAALRDGWTADELRRVFEYPDGRGAEGRIVQHLWNHHDHLHVRVGCPPRDRGCEP